MEIMQESISCASQNYIAAERIHRKSPTPRLHLSKFTKSLTFSRCKNNFLFDKTVLCPRLKCSLRYIIWLDMAGRNTLNQYKVHPFLSSFSRLPVPLPTPILICTGRGYRVHISLADYVIVCTKICKHFL